MRIQFPQTEIDNSTSGNESFLNELQLDYNELQVD